MSIGGTPIPKREIISMIQKYIPSEQIRSMLRIQYNTDPKRRLEDFSKSQLLDVLQVTPDGKYALEKAKANYPLNSNPTLYLVNVSYWPNHQELLEKTTFLAKQARDEALPFGDERTVRVVYSITPMREYHNQLVFQEIPLVYEKKIEYTIADTKSENFGDIEVIYSLEKALIWYCEQYKHALLLCGDFYAVKPILFYGSSKLGIRWQLPYLSEDMLLRLAKGANPRTASFSQVEDGFNDILDAHTMTISDHGLADSIAYKKLTQDKSRHQTFGFYSTHPDLVFGGLGISRQYGRIWTPARLRKDSLLALAFNLIQKTEEELGREIDINVSGYIAYYKNRPILLGDKKINQKHRSLVEKLIEAIIISCRSDSQEFSLDPEIIFELIMHSDKLDLMPALEVQCENCGGYLLNCSLCNSPFEVTFEEDNSFSFQCPNHPEKQIRNDQIIKCDCGSELEVTYSNDIRIIPGAELLKTLNDFLSILENQEFNGSFQIIGNTLRLIPKSINQIAFYSLDSYTLWRNIAHIHQRTISENEKFEFRKILFRIKEKCKRNDSHPTNEICRNCMQEKISKARINNGTEICLPRILGYVIDKDFDGIHHGHEIADIKYSDTLHESSKPMNLGIHLKSRKRPRKKGLGRSVSSIKGLYTQYCYSAYSAKYGKTNFDVIGISIPNIINIEVIENFKYLSNQLGIPLIILDENDWIRIIDVALEKAEFENN
jgi:hypothetical protein